MAASRSNTQNQASYVTNGEPEGNYKMPYPGFTFGIGYGFKVGNKGFGISLNSNGEASVSKDVGPFAFGTSGVEYKSYVPKGGYSTDVVYQDPYFVVHGNTVIKRVDIADVVTTGSSAMLTSTNIKRFKCETKPNGTSTGYVNTYDSTEFNLEVTTPFLGGSTITGSAPVKATRNMAKKPVPLYQFQIK